MTRPRVAKSAPPRRITFEVPADTVERIDAKAAELGLSRTALLLRLLDRAGLGEGVSRGPRPSRTFSKAEKRAGREQGKRLVHQIRDESRARDDVAPNFKHLGM